MTDLRALLARTIAHVPADLREEIWSRCARYPSYAVSTKGRVASLRRGCHLLKQQRPRGYMMVSPWEGDKYGRESVHRLVAEAFLPNPDGLPYINHKDGNKSNNDVVNLEWCTPSQNSFHAYRTGLKGPPSNKKYPTPEIMARIESMPLYKLAKIVGVSEKTLKRWSTEART